MLRLRRQHCLCAANRIILVSTLVCIHLVSVSMADSNEFGALDDQSSVEDSLQSKITREVGENIAKNALKAGSEKAKSLFDSYTKVIWHSTFIVLLVFRVSLRHGFVSHRIDRILRYTGVLLMMFILYS